MVPVGIESEMVTMVGEGTRVTGQGRKPVEEEVVGETRTVVSRGTTEEVETLVLQESRSPCRGPQPDTGAGWFPLTPRGPSRTDTSEGWFTGSPPFPVPRPPPSSSRGRVPGFVGE